MALSNLTLHPILRFDRGVYRNDDGDAVINYFSLSPRFHFTWDPFSDQRTAVRGGYGRSIDPGNKLNALRLRLGRALRK